MTTMVAAGAGGIGALLMRGLLPKKPGLPLIINGILGGLVGVTASSAYVSIFPAILIGLISSFVVIFIEYLLVNLNIDDPVGAIPVHLGGGICGTLLVAFLSEQAKGKILDILFPQLIGILCVNATILLFSSIFWISIGMAIYLIESRIQTPGIQYTNQSHYLPLPKKASFFDRTLILLRNSVKALRVSEQDEDIGSDGTFHSNI